MSSLFDSLREYIPPKSDWRPEMPPSLDGVKEIYLNFETTGVRWWLGDHPISLTIRFGDRSWYLPWRHAGGGNLPEEQVKRYVQQEIKNKRITNANTRFEVHMARVWGIDLEAQGNEVSDVQHYAALLDDHRRRFAIDILARDILGEQPMERLNEGFMLDYHSSEAAPRAMYNVELVERLKNKMWPELDKQGLQGIRALEDKVIYPVVEMEKNGFPIDLDLLERYIKDSQIVLNKMLWDLSKAAGFQCNPDSSKDMQRLFELLKIPFTEFTKTGQPSFKDHVLARIDHPTVQLARRAGKLASLRSKFIVATKQHLVGNTLYYALHQLRTEKAEGGDAGTVTGRFSSGSLTERPTKFGVNIQQRSKPAKQRTSFGINDKDTSHDEEIFLIRKLHIAGKGSQVIASDMDQAQYRIFAHYVNNPSVIAAYKENPKISFHKYMHKKLAERVVLTYGQQKDLNFAYIFGAGLAKQSLMVGHITQSQYDEIIQTQRYDSPLLEPTKAIRRAYEEELPEVKDLLATAMHLAKPCCDQDCKTWDKLHKTYEHRGYVRTLKGRRMRFPTGQRLHKAFNGVDQGTEADYMKTKLVEIHNSRKQTGFVLRVTNHDELVGDGDIGVARSVDKILNTQSFPELRVPLTWETSIGPNWADLKGIE